MVLRPQIFPVVTMACEIETIKQMEARNGRSGNRAAGTTVMSDAMATRDSVFYNTVFKQIPLKGRPGGGEFERLNNYHNQERRVI